MDQALDENLVGLRGVFLGSETHAMLTLDHAEGGFYVASLVIMSHELLLVVVEIAIHLCPEHTLA